LTRSGSPAIVNLLLIRLDFNRFMLNVETQAVVNTNKASIIAEAERSKTEPRRNLKDSVSLSVSVYRPPASPSKMSDQRNQKEHQENNKQQLCDARSRNGDASEPQNPGD
jgi:hypothetical protein